jgi:hypothetical protein
MKTKIKDVKILQQKLKEDADFNSAALTIYTPLELEYIKNYKTPLQKIIEKIKDIDITPKIQLIILVIISILGFLIFSTIAINYEKSENTIRESDRYEKVLGIE